MDKRAETTHPIHELLAVRWSPRAFADRDVEPEVLAGLFEAARWAPSSYNEQPWTFILATRREPDEFARLLACLVEANRRWAGAAPVLMLSLAKMHFEKTGKPNRHALHDVGLAAGNLVVEATARGLVVHQMAGIDLERCRTTYSIPPSHEPVAGLALGYLGDPDRLPDDLRQRELAPRRRKPIEQFVFRRQWGVSAYAS